MTFSLWEVCVLLIIIHNMYPGGILVVIRQVKDSDSE